MTEERDSRKQLEMRKRDGHKDVRKLEGIKCIDEASKNVLKESWQEELVQIKQRRSDLFPEHERMQIVSQKLQSLEDKLAQSKNHLRKLGERNKLARMEIGK